MSKLSYPENPYNPQKRTIIIVPGYRTGDQVDWRHELLDKWLEYEDVNVIVVNWSIGNHGLYDTAVANVRIVSRQITILLYYLAKLNNQDFRSPQFRSNIQLVGHSLGAHISGFVGKEFNGQLGRITGLDPAGPIFDKLASEFRLSRSDAQFVDVIHTNAGVLRYMKCGFGIIKDAALSIWDRVSPFGRDDQNTAKQSDGAKDNTNYYTAWFGIEAPVGHIDYYANGGSNQPGCNRLTEYCDHERASQLYISFLEYEIKSRNMHGDDSEIIKSGQHRFVAFPSNNYEYFKTGATLMRNCPQLVWNNKLTEEQRSRAYKTCSIPIDFVSRGRDVKARLEQEYGLDFDSGEEMRFYFETLSSKPYISEHYLLKVHLNKDNNNWSRGCKFNCDSSSKYNRRLFFQIDYSSDDLTLVEVGDFYGLIIPYANPVDWRLQYPTPAMLQEIPPTKDGEIMIPVSSQLDSYLVDCIMASMTRKSSEKSYSSILWSDPDEICQLNLIAFESKPLVASVADFSTWYLASYGTEVTAHSMDYESHLIDKFRSSDRDARTLNMKTGISLCINSILIDN